MKPVLHAIMIALSIIWLVAPIDAEQETNSLKLSPTLLLKSIEEEVKKPDYLTTILPYDCTPLLDLLNFGKQTDQGTLFVRDTFRIFGNMHKAAPYVSAEHCQELLDQLIPLLIPYFTPVKESSFARELADAPDKLAELHYVTATLLYRNLNDRYDFFRNDPEAFLDEMAHNIAIIAEHEINKEQTRQIIVRFFETVFSKLIWATEDNEKIWESVKNITNKLARFAEQQIIDDVDDLNDLLWTITYRFAYFLDITSPELDAALFQAIKNDLGNDQLSFLAIEEQESFLESKRDYLTRAVLAAQAKREAYQAGIILP